MIRTRHLMHWLVGGMLLLLGIVTCHRAHGAEQRAYVLLMPTWDSTDASWSWWDRGLGKLDTGTGDGGHASRARLRGALDYDAQFTDVFSARLSAAGELGTHGDAGLTEGWLTYAPVPTSPWQYRLRGGLFIPPFSLENTGTGWSSPYMLSTSVLDSWLGEEIHVTGLEFTARHLGAQSRSPHTFTLRGAVFEGNDTAGTLLSWRGWAVNDRVTPAYAHLPLPDRLAFRPGGTFQGTHWTDPVREIDHRPGYYVSGSWRYLDRVEFIAGRYDNRADPLEFDGHQAGWRTQFNVLGMRWNMGEGTEILAQYLEGDTLLGRAGLQFNVYNTFSAWYLLATHSWTGQRISARYEHFDVRDKDHTLQDDNNEHGHVWAGAYQYEIHRDVWLGLEYLSIFSDRPERAFIGLTPAITEKQFRLALRWTL